MPLTKVGDENCMMCELAMSYVKSMLSKNATEQQVEQTLEKVCNYLSGDMAQQVRSLSNNEQTVNFYELSYFIKQFPLLRDTQNIIN